MAMKALREVRLVLPMEPDREVEASETASALAASVNMDPDRIDELRMAVLEACINAFEHSLATDGKVYVTLRLLGDRAPQVLQVVVRDTGVGFPEDRVGSAAGKGRDTMPKAQAGPRKRGWGLTIIQRLMDEVSIESGAEGTVVVMSKQIGAGAGAGEGAGGAG